MFMIIANEFSFFNLIEIFKFFSQRRVQCMQLLEYYLWQQVYIFLTQTSWKNSKTTNLFRYFVDQINRALFNFIEETHRCISSCYWNKEEIHLAV